MLLNLHMRLPAVVAKPVVDHQLAYTTNGTEIVSGIEHPPRIRESMVNQRNLSINVMEGYDPSVATELNNHSIYHLYEYESKTRFLDSLPTSKLSIFDEMPTRFLLCRYVICLIDDAMRLEVPMELIAIRVHGDIYIGANKTTEKHATENRKMSAYGGLNFPRMVTTSRHAVSFENHHSVVKELRLEKRESVKAMTLFVSSVARAFDGNGKVVEVKTCGIDVRGKLQNLPSVTARNWWLRALLSGADRIVYGLRRSDRKIHEIQEAKLTDLTNGHFHFNGNELFSFIFNLFEKISDMIPEEGSMCIIRSADAGKLSIEKTTSESLKRSPFW